MLYTVLGEIGKWRGDTKKHRKREGLGRDRRLREIENGNRRAATIILIIHVNPPLFLGCKVVVCVGQSIITAEWRPKRKAMKR